MKYLKYFETEALYASYKNGGDYVTPNVSYVVETKGISYDPKKAFTLRAKYNATPDNLDAFIVPSNLKSLKVNGTPIEFEPIKNETITFDVLSENISLDASTGAATFPDSYLIKSPVSSWSFKAKDPNYTINENTYACGLMMMNGATMASPMPIAELMGYAFTTNDGVTLEATDTFLAEMNVEIQSGMQIVFTLMNVDVNSGTFVFIDTEHQTNMTTGGLSTYSFDSEGLYDVEIELFDPVMKDIQFNGNSLIDIEIGYGITSISDYAFSGCSGLTSVVIPDSVTSIGSYAFQDCSGLTSIVIGSGVTSIGSYAFQNCTGLTGVYISDIAAWCNISFDGYAQISSNPLSNGHNLYLNNELVTDLTIPDSVTTINNYAFKGCGSLTSVNIPDSVTTINDFAFYGCNITSVTIGAGVTFMGTNTFGYCRDLASITCYAPTAPTIHYTTFQAVDRGILKVPAGSDYSSWMSKDLYYLGSYNWTIQYI